MADDGSRPSRAKRQKIKLACQACRDRKTRCDGLRPHCSMCLKRGVSDSCEYEAPTSVSRKYISELKERIIRLEQGSNSEADLNVLQDDGLSTSGSIHSNLQNAAPTERNDAAASPTSHMVSIDSAGVDGLATVPYPSSDDCVYGDSSTIAFVRRVIHEGQKSSVGAHRQQPMETMPEKTEGAEVYPLRRAADDYLHCYWEFIHPIFPVLHKPSFMRRFEALWSESRGPNPGSKQEEFDHVVFTSTLNLVFALGCQFSNLVREPNRAHVAEEFYQRARKLFVFDILDSASITLVQMLLLTAIYLQSTSHANRCWNVVGLAIRAAQSIGLDSEPPTRTPRDQLARELRRRLWHTCVTMDRLVAMTFGRATITSGTENVPRPLGIDDEFLNEEHEGVQPVEKVPRLGLFVWSLNLYDILHEILTTLYHKGQDKSALRGRDGENWKLLSDILTLNQRLDEFLERLPEYLRPQSQSMSPPDSQNADHEKLQRQVLQCRFLYTRVILLRPLLLLGNDLDGTPTRSGSPMTTPHLRTILFESACSLCVQTGHLLIEKLHENLETPYRISAWHSVYLAVGAAIVLLSAQERASFDAEPEQAGLARSWQRCLGVLGHYKQRIGAAHQAIRVLESLRHELMSKHAKANGTVDPERMVVEPGSINMNQLQDNNGGAANNERNPFGNFSDYYGVDTAWNGFGFPEEGAAWLSQHLVDLDWMELPWLPPA